MSAAVEPVLVLLLALNFFALGTSRLRAAINAVALQGGLLGALMILMYGFTSVRSFLAGLIALAIKGLLIPALLHRAQREAAIRREIEPYIGYVASLLVGALATGAAVLFADRLPLAAADRGSLLIPAALATVLVGFVIMATRRKAITQVVGYLVLENGIFMLGLTIHAATPLLVEVGVLLDLLVGIFVIGIVINHISREFASLDVARLDALKD